MANLFHFPASSDFTPDFLIKIGPRAETSKKPVDIYLEAGFEAIPFLCIQKAFWLHPNNAGKGLKKGRRKKR